MKNLLKISTLSIFIIFISIFSDISTVSAYSVLPSLYTPGSSLVSSVGYPQQTSNAQSIAYNGNAQVKWTTVGFSSCSCSYSDLFTGGNPNCTPSGATTGTNILSTVMTNLRNNVVDYGTFTSNTLHLSCMPTPCIAGSTGILGSGVSSGSWTVPATNTGYDNCTFKVEAWGGGGGGHGGHGDTSGGSGADGGAGGGAGAYRVETASYGGAGPLYFYPGSLLTYTIGSGGGSGNGGNSGNNAGSQGSAGTYTGVAVGGTTIINAGGGGVGLDNGNGGCYGCGNTNNFNTYSPVPSGANGQNYNVNISQYGGDGGTSPNGGAGGAAHGNNGNNSAGNTGDNGSFPGGGGGGGGGADGGSSAHGGGAGGIGATGGVRISWYPTIPTSSPVNFSLPIPVNPLSPSGTLTSTTTTYTPSGFSGPVNCTIATYNGTTCNATLVWTTTNTTSNSRIRVYNASTYTSPGYPDTATQQSQYVLGTNNPNTTTNQNLSSGSFITGTIPYGASTLELYDIRSNVANQPDANQWHLYKLATLQVTAACAQNTHWASPGCVNDSITATITTSPASCSIAVGASTCSVGVTWSSNNYLSASIKEDGNEFSTALNQSTPITRNISNGTHPYSYYSGTSLIATTNAVASCISGSMWNGSLCASATISSTPTCTILQNASNCNVNVSWSSNGISSASVKQDDANPPFSTLANQSTAVSRTISNGSHNFKIYSGSTLLSTATSVASCISNTAWNGTMCVPSATGNITSTASCTIPANSSTCPVSVTWTTSSSINGLGIYQGGTQFSTSANQSPTPVSRNINYGSNSFSIYGINGVNTILYDVSYSSGVCTSGTTWNGTVCSSAVITSEPGCTIAANASDCNVNVTWISNSLVSPIIKQDSTQFSTSANSSSPVSRTISEGSHNFTISDGSTVVGTSTSVASCGYGSNWNGSICVAVPTAIITADPICQIRPNDSTCDVNVSWTSANLSQPSVDKDSTQISTSPSDTSIETISHGFHSFTIYSRSTVMDTSNSQAVCPPTAPWDGTVCASPQSATISSDPTCAILAGMSTCDVNVSWASSTLSSPSIEQDAIQFSTAPNNPMPGMLKIITYGIHTFTIKDGTVVLDTSTSGAWCVVGTSWDGSSCVGVAGSLTATLTANPTKIVSGSPSTLTWGSTGATKCSGTGFNANNLTSGSVIVKPKVTTTYKITCYDSSGAGAFQNAKVSVGKLQTIYSEGKTTTYIELQDKQAIPQ